MMSLVDYENLSNYLFNCKNTEKNKTTKTKIPPRIKKVNICYSSDFLHKQTKHDRMGLGEVFCFFVCFDSRKGMKMRKKKN